MQILVSRAGLVLNPGQVADLVLAWRQLAGLIASLPHERRLADDAAFGFRLPPPAGGQVASTRAAPAPDRPARRAAAPKPPPKRSAAAKPGAKARAAKPKARAAARPKARSGTKRGQ